MCWIGLNWILVKEFSGQWNWVMDWVKLNFQVGLSNSISLRLFIVCCSLFVCLFVCLFVVHCLSLGLWLLFWFFVPPPPPPTNNSWSHKQNNARQQNSSNPNAHKKQTSSFSLRVSMTLQSAFQTNEGVLVCDVNSTCTCQLQEHRSFF